jgi:hypothetical protein
VEFWIYLERDPVFLARFMCFGRLDLHVLLRSDECRGCNFPSVLISLWLSMLYIYNDLMIRFRSWRAPLF